MSNNTNLSKIDFEKATKHPKEVISDYLVGYNTGIHTKLPRRDMKTLMIMLDGASKLRGNRCQCWTSANCGGFLEQAQTGLSLSSSDEGGSSEAFKSVS